MFEPEKKRYLTRGIDTNISLELQIFLWNAIDNMPEPKDYLQVFELNAKDGVQYIFHKSEQPTYEMTYILPAIQNAVNAKI